MRDAEPAGEVRLNSGGRYRPVGALLVTPNEADFAPTVANANPSAASPRLSSSRTADALLGMRFLKRKSHQECHDGRAGIDDELPSVRKMKEGPGNRPDQYGAHCKGKYPGPSYFPCGDLRQIGKDSAQRVLCRQDAGVPVRVSAALGP